MGRVCNYVDTGLQKLTHQDSLQKGKSEGQFRKDQVWTAAGEKKLLQGKQIQQSRHKQRQEMEAVAHLRKSIHG